jgi:hypothetical protein
MARRETDREDLLREATALVERIELRVVGFDEPIVAGFRRDGSASFYFGADPVYQFNAASQLRRAFIGGLPVKAETGRLIALARERLANEVALVRTELAGDQAAAMLTAADGRLQNLHNTLASGEYTVVGQVPDEIDLAGRVSAWLAALPRPIVVAQAPNVG